LDFSCDFEAFAGTTRTVFATVWHADTLPYTCAQQSFVSIDGERTATGLNQHLKRHACYPLVLSEQRKTGFCLQTKLPLAHCQRVSGGLVS
jgi:hypothetical protein